MRASRKRKILAVIAVGVAVFGCVAGALAFEPVRSVLVRTVLSAALSFKGFDLRTAEVHLGGGRLVIHNLAIDDYSRAPFLSAHDVRVGYERHGLMLSVDAIEVDQPRLTLRREADGSFNAARLFGIGSQPASAQSAPSSNEGASPLTLRLRDGSIDLENPTAPARPGRRLWLDRIDVAARIDKGNISHGHLSALLGAPGQRSVALGGSYLEDDRTQLATVKANARGVPIAPLLDYFISSPAFIVERGTGDLVASAYALQWSSGGPAWHILAHGLLHDGQLSVAPLIAPARRVHGPFEFADGVLSLPLVTGDAANLGLAARGSIALVPVPQLDLLVQTSGPLARARRLLAFSKPLPLLGHVDVQARVNGTPADPRVAVSLNFPQGFRYATTPVTSARVLLVYNRNHVTLRSVLARYAGFAIDGDGDVDVTSQKSPSGQFSVALRGPARSIPWVANLDDRATVLGEVTLAGPLSKLQGSGFISMNGPAGRIRTSFAAGPERFTFGPLLALDRRGGSLWLASSVDRANLQQVSADLVAHHYSLALNGSKTGLPGIFNRPFGTPQASAIIDGVASVSGPLSAPQVSAQLRERNLILAGSRYGDMALRALGQGGLAWINVKGQHATIAGIPFQNATAFLGLGADRVRIFNASAQAAGGYVALSGDLPLRADGRTPHELVAIARGIQLADLRSAGVPVDAGALTAFGELQGSSVHPRASLSATLSQAEVSGRELNADTHLEYNGKRLVVAASRIVFGNGSALNASGVVSGLGLHTALSRANLKVNGSVRDADVAELAGANMPQSLPLTGSVNADVTVRGTLGAPVIAGSVDSPVGTVRGVTYEDMRAQFGLDGGALTLRGGHLQIGSSPIDLSGLVEPGAARLALATPKVDLADFNDFFNGADILEGHGSMNLSLDAAGPSSGASGALRLNDTEVVHVPLGAVNGSLATHDGITVAQIHQRGALGSTDIRASVALAPQSVSQFDLSQARYSAQAQARNLDVGMLASLVPNLDSQAVRGKLDVDLMAQGKRTLLGGAARFNLLHGFVGKNAIEDFSGQVSADSAGIHVNPLDIALQGVTLAARGTYFRTGRISAHALLKTANLSTAARLANVRSPLTGGATLTLDASGTAAQPDVHALLDAGNGMAFGVPYQRIGLDTKYAPGSIAVRDVTVQFPRSDGSIVASGVAPIAYGPQPPDPPGIPIRHPFNLRVRAVGLDLSAFNPLLGQRGSLAGKLDLQASATGNPGRPQLAGTGSLRDATIRSKVETVPLTGLNADLAFTNDKIQLSRLHGVLGKGSIDASAIARLVPAASGREPGSLSYTARVLARNANLSVPNLFSGVLNMDLGVLSSHKRSQVAGSIDISDTDVPFAGIIALASGTAGSGPPQAGQIPGVPPWRKGHTIEYGGSIYGDEDHFVQPTPKPVPPRVRSNGPLALDVTMTAGKNVQTTGLVNATATGSVHAGGTLGSPKLHGTLNVVRGQVSLFDTTFDLQRGWVAFHSRDGFLPSVDAVAVAYRPEAQVTATVQGRVDHLNTQLESDPPMSEDQIIANILHINQINQAMNGGGTGQTQNAGAAVGNFVGSAVTGKLLAAVNYGLEQTLHLEEVNLAFDANGNPSVEFRKQYGPHTYATFRQSFAVPPQQAYGMVYTVRDALELELMQQNNPQGLLGQDIFLPRQQTTLQATYHFPNRQHPLHRKKPKH